MRAISSKLETTLPKDFYFSEDIYALEKERIFCREWFCAGRCEQIPNSGDYLLLDVAGESILVVRTGDFALKAFYNVCRHRGSRLVASEGCEPNPRSVTGPSGAFASGIRCPYHSWTYTLDGALRTAPFLSADDEFYKEEFALYPVGLETWGGFFFLHLTPDEARSTGHNLLVQIDPVPARLERYPLSELHIGRRVIYEVDANWKVMLENYNECYHCGGVHPELCEIVPQFKKAGGSDLDWERGIPHKEGAFTFTRTGKTTRSPFPALNDDEKVRHKGELIYPNFLLSLSADHVAAFTLWPRGPLHTTIVCDFLFHPDEMKKPDFDPSDAADFWDLVNRQDWKICENVQRGMSSRVFEQGYYAPMESWSLDIRRYIRERLGTTVLPAQ